MCNPNHKNYSNYGKQHVHQESLQVFFRQLHDRHHHQPISVISEALGHDSETTTQIYLRSIQTSEVDKLNAELLSELI